MLQRFRWLALALVLGGAYCVWLGWQDHRLRARLDEVGQVVVGTIDSGEVESGRGSRKTHRFAVSYTTEAGRAFRRDFEVGERYFEHHVRGDAIVRDAVKVKYDPADPERAILVGGSTDLRGTLPIGGGILGIGALLGASILVQRRRAASVVPGPASASAAADSGGAGAQDAGA
jgi:hypothetical protein